jgi:hypothetical protein
MAELTATTADPCCPAEQQATCCEPNAKADCCGHEESCVKPAAVLKLSANRLYNLDYPPDPSRVLQGCTCEEAQAMLIA